MKKNTSRKIAMSALMLALALIVSLLEGLLPPIIPALPYVKIGFGNIILLLAFLLIGPGEGYVILILKCLLASVFAGNVGQLAWSIPSSLVSYTLMIILVKTRLFSTIGVSIAGGMMHNIIQICMASVLVEKSVFIYLPYMILAGGLAGLITGFVCHFLVVRFKDNFVNIKLKNIEYYRVDNKENIID